MTYTRRNPEVKKPNRMRVSVPEHAGPHVKLVFSEMARQRVNYWELEGRSGIQKATIKAWRYKNVPSLTGLESCMNALGWDLIPVPRDRIIDADILAELQPIANRLGLSMGDAIQFATEIAVGLHSKEEPAPEPEPARPVLRLRGDQEAELHAGISRPALLTRRA